MPKKGYKQTEEHKTKIALSVKRKKEETKQERTEKKKIKELENKIKEKLYEEFLKNYMIEKR